MTSPLRPVVGAMFVVMVACQTDGPTEPSGRTFEPAEAMARGNGGAPGNSGKGQDVPLMFDYSNVTVRSDGAVVITGVRNDGRQTTHGTTYVDGGCGVQASLRDGASGWLVPGLLKIKRKDADRCDGADPRFVLLDLTSPVDGGDGAGVLEATAMNLYLDIASVPVGESQLREGKVNHEVCGALQYVIESDGVSTGADLLLVSRPDADTWIVQTREDPVTGEPLDRAWCRNEGENGRLYHVPLRLQIKVVKDE